MPDDGSVISSDGSAPAKPSAGSRFTARVIETSILLVLCAAVYVIGISSLPPVDRDECRFAQASRQMFEAAALPADQLDLRKDDSGTPIGRHAGGWAVPMVGETPRLNKPPLVYWLQTASAWFFTGGDPSTDAMWMYRVPSALSAFITVLLTWRIGAAMRSATAGYLAAAFVAVCPMFVWDAHQARADQLMTATVAGAMFFLWRIHRHRAMPRSMLKQLLDAGGLWVCIGLGLLAKGPVTPMVAGLGWAALVLMDRGPSRRAMLVRVHAWLGLPLLAAILLPWAVAIEQSIGLRRYLSIVWDEFFVRAASGSREGHFAPPGFHLVLLVVLFWPGCHMALVGVIDAFRRVRHDRDECGRASSMIDPDRFLLAWLVPSWVLFELSLAKLPHYTMPLYPAVGLLAARYIARLDHQRMRACAAKLLPLGVRPLNHGDRLFYAVGVVGAAIVALAFACSYRFADPAIVKSSGPVSTPSVIGMVIGGGLLLLFCRGLFGAARVQRLRLPMLSAMIAVVVAASMIALIVSFAAPQVVPGRLSNDLFAVVRQLDPTQTRPIASVYHEDSMVFAARGRLSKVNDAGMLDWLKANTSGIAVIDERMAQQALELGFLPASIPLDGENSTRPRGERKTGLIVVIKQLPPNL